MKKEEIACRIIEFWYIIEFLSQDVFPVETRENKKRIKQLRDLANNTGITQKEKDKYKKYRKTTLFYDFPSEQSIGEQINEDNTVFTTLPETGTKKHLCIGKLRREFLIKALYACLGIEDNRPEEDNSDICLMALKVDEEGAYVSNSLRISPILWGLCKCIEAQGKMDETIIHSDKYNEEINKIERTIDTNEPLDNEKINKLYDTICEQYIQPLGDLSSAVTLEGLFIYTRYKNKKICIQEEELETDYSELISGFYTDDLLMVKQAISQMSSSHPKSIYNEIIDYIIGIHYEDINREICPDKIDIRNNKEAIAQWLSADRSPLGKWPSKYSPALMQQIAINIAITENEDGKAIFSVNGPPGTGKTTLLKEIIASNIVSRAGLLCNYENPDDAFLKKEFEDGLQKDHGYDQYQKYYYTFRNPDIARYGMLVASCNNAAVENITKELPDGKKLLGDLESGKNDEEEIAEGLAAVANCFDRSQSTKNERYRYFNAQNKKDFQEITDVYFSKLAAELMSDENQPVSPDFTEWGLVSAPMGKRGNINKYYYSVLNELIENFLKQNDSIAERKKQYLQIKEEFNEQWKKVSCMKDDLCDFMKLSEKYDELGQKEELLSLNTTKVAQMQEAYETEISKLEGLESVYKSICNSLIEKEDARKWYEILFSKWIHSERLRQIAELKEKKQHIKHQTEQGELLAAALLQQKQQLEEEKLRLSSYISHIRTEWNNKQETYKGTLTEINKQFWEDFESKDEKTSTRIQTTTPWTWHAYNREREKLFFLALQVHKEFILSSKCCRSNFINLAMMWKYRENSNKELCTYSTKDKQNAYSHLLNTLFLLTPVMSTTFASVGRFLKYIDQPGSLGTLIIDEAGQASPHVALGALWRCQKAIIVGDPKQVEPVVTDDADAIKYAFSDDIIRPYLNKTISVQEFADKINPYGSYIKNSFDEDAAPTWVGCPLVVHRRCINPMFGISNELSYDGTMKIQTQQPKVQDERKFIEAESYWINVEGKEKGNKNHFVEEQGEAAYKLVVKGFENYGEAPDLYIISPFTTVINGIKNKILSSPLLKRYGTEEVEKWANESCGTVHKFQGKEAKEVIFLLGCDEKAMGAIKWVKPNIVNVAVTRAKYRLYVIGNYGAWQKSDLFKTLKNRLVYKPYSNT